MSQNRYKLLIHRTLAFLLALYIFNFSIDSQDAQPDHLGEDLSHNDIESIAEFIVEIIFDVADAFNEHDEKDNYDGTTGFYKYCCSSTLTEVENLSPFIELSAEFETRYAGVLEDPSVKITAPPPRG
jgi:hypothetical protein